MRAARTVPGRRILTAGVLVATLSLGVSACGISGGVYDMPLPGGADVGSSPYTLKANFTDVLDLVPQSSVKVDNVAVGRVSKITLNPDGRSARVAMTLRRSVRLPVGTTARLQQTSLLGEKYVALVRPGQQQDSPLDGAGDDGGVDDPTFQDAGTGVGTSAPTARGGYLSNGDVLPLDKTSQAVGIEQVLGALSLLLNGGGLGQFQEISRELQQVSGGRPDEIRAFLQTTASFVKQLDERRGSITAALDGLAQLSKTLDQQQPQIKTALDDLSPGLKVLADQRPQLVKMLTALDKLSTVSVRTLDAAQDDIVTSLKNLDPILDQLAKAGDAFPKSLEVLFTYPFPDSVLKAIKGDYLNVFLTTNLATKSGPWAQQSAWDLSSETPPTKVAARGVASSPMFLPPTSSAAPGMDSPTLPGSPQPSPGDGSPSSSPSGTPTSGDSPSGSASPSDPADDQAGER